MECWYKNRLMFGWWSTEFFKSTDHFGMFDDKMNGGGIVLWYYHPFFWLLLRHCKFKRSTFTNIIYRRSPIVNNVDSEKCRIRTCKMAVLEAAAVAIEPTSQNELGYHHSVASLSHSASVRVPWPVHLIIILCISSADRIRTCEWWAENPLT